METGSPGKRPVLPKRARLLVTAGMGMLALLLFGPRLVDIYVDWLWFGEVGFRSVWITVLLTRLAIVAAVALVVAGIVLAALLLAYRSRPFFVPDEPQREPGRATSQRGDAPAAPVRVGHRRHARCGVRADRFVRLGEGSVVRTRGHLWHRGPRIRL